MYTGKQSTSKEGELLCSWIEILMDYTVFLTIKYNKEVNDITVKKKRNGKQKRCFKMRLLMVINNRSLLFIEINPTTVVKKMKTEEIK